jgi:two-component system, chemotaxis family, protein-glutamate methylesterase/glutaminase
MMLAFGSYAIVVIGASKGGVEALNSLAEGLTSDIPAALFIVQHIGSHPSSLPEILSRAGPLPAMHASQGQAIRPGEIYVAPPDHHLLLKPRSMTLSRGPRENWARPAIDPLFRSAAAVYGPAVIGVILTGGLNDGTAGLKAVRDAGGRAVVQDPAEALCPEMPASALHHVGADHCISLRDMPLLLNHLAKEFASRSEDRPFAARRRTNP